MGTWRARPPITDQSDGLPTCWAHALESWTFATHGVSNETVAELLDRFRALGCVTPAGALRASRALPHLKRIYDLDAEKMTDPATLTPAKVQAALRRAHALLAYTSAPSDGPQMHHAVVIYGADKFSMCVMDPLAYPEDELPGAYLTYRISDFRRDKTEMTLLSR